MKTLRLLLVLAFMLTCISGALAFEKTILVEYFTNVNCGPCAGQHDPIEDMLNNYTRDEIAYICYHTSWPSSSDGYYVGNIPENTGRWTYYGVNYVPWFQGEGLWGDQSQLNSLLPLITPRIGTYTPYQIEFDAWPEPGVDVPITATLTCAEATQGDMRFNIVLVDKMQVVAPGSNGIDDYKYNMIDMAYSYQGQSFTSAGGNEQLVYNYTFDIPDNNTFGNLGVVAYVQDYSTSEIFQARYLSSPEVIINGAVTHEVTGDPIEGVEVLLNNGVDGSTVTNAEGGYAFFGLVEGDYEILVSLENYVDITVESQFYAFGIHTIDFGMENENVNLPMIGYVNTEGAANGGGTIVGDLGYFAQGNSGLRIVDVSDPTNITTLGSTTVGAMAKDVIVNGSAAYVATTSGFKVVNVSDPANPTSGQGMSFGSTAGMDLAGNYFFAASATNGMIVMNAANPLNPQYMTMFNTSGEARDIVVQGTHAYIAISENGLAIVDVSTPASPSLVTELDVGPSCTALDLSGNIAYLALGSSGFAAVDISDPANPVHISTLATAGDAVQIKVVDDVVFIANYFFGQRVYDASDPNNMVEVGYSLTPDASNHVTVAGDVAYGSDSGFIYAFDGSAFLGGANDPVTLTLVGTQTEIPAGGGTVVYDATVQSTLPYAVTNCFYRTYAQLPNNDLVGPLSNQSFTLAAFMNVTVPGLTLEVPIGAPAGTYTFYGEISRQGFPQTVTDSFNFTKLGAVTDGEYVFDPADWKSGGSFIIASEDAQVITPVEFEIAAAYPNPFNPTTSLALSLPEAVDVSVQVFNVIGQQVATLTEGRLNAGQHTLTFDATGLTSGVYFIHTNVPGQYSNVQKVLLVR